MPSFQPSGQSGTGFGGDFNFSTNAASNPFAQTNGTSGTPPPTNFQFGSQTQTNGSGSGFGGGSNPFASAFGGADKTQPQQNGFASSTTPFGQTQPGNTQNSTSSIFSSFGQNNNTQPQSNGVTPSTAATPSFPSFGNTAPAQTPFKGFGQSQQSTQSTQAPSFGFGQSQEPTPSTQAPSFNFGQSAQQNGDKPASTPFSFGQATSQSQSNGNKPSPGPQTEETPKAAPSSTFAGFGQQNGQKPLFSATPQPEKTTSNLFSTQSSAGTGLFGSTPPPDSNSQSLKPGASVFSSVNQKDGISSTMFTQSRDSTPKPPSNMFGAPAQQSDSDATPSANKFNGFGQTQASAQKPSFFSAAPASQSGQETPKAATSLFSGGFGQQQPSQSSTTPAFNFGQTPQKATDSAPQSQPPADTDASLASTTSQASGAEGKSLFDRVTPRDDAPPTPTAQKFAFTPSTTLFNASTPGAGMFEKAAAPPSTPATAIKESSTTAPRSLQETPSAAPWLSHGPSALTTGSKSLQPPVPATPAKPSTPAATTHPIPESEKKTLKFLNEGLKAHLATQDPYADWSKIMQFYLEQAAKITNVPSVSLTQPTAPNTVQNTPSAPLNVFAASQANSTPKPTAPSTTAAFQFTPKPSAASVSQPPQTAPVNRKRSAEDDAPQEPPATEKRSRPNETIKYPQLPENASNTSRLFQAALNKSAGPAAPTSQLQSERETGEKQQQQQQQAPTFGGFKPSQPAQTSEGFKPSGFTGFTPSGAAPSAPSGMPTFAAPATGGGGFLAAFGKKANDQEEKERKKRKAEDYDSDEETEEQWAARDKAEQEAKKQKILDAAKSGAIFTPASAGTPAASDDGHGVDDVEATPVAQAKGLPAWMTSQEPPATAPSKIGAKPTETPFTPMTSSKFQFGSKTPFAAGGASSTSNIFGNASKPSDSTDTADADKTEAEKEQGRGDHTWKQSTPIKFGSGLASGVGSTTPAGNPPSFGTLFGATNQKSASDASGHLAKPNFGFNFGTQSSSLTNSRATTPGLTTDGEGASTAGEGEDEESAAPVEPQVEDQTGLRESELETEDVLFSVHKAKATKWDEKKSDSGEMSMGWVDRGKGPLYILKNKESGKVRVVLKVPPFGVTKMNFAPLKNMQYEVTGKAGKMVQGVFIDHLESSAAKEGASQFSKWLVQVGSKEDAEEIARVLMEERA